MSGKKNKKNKDPAKNNQNFMQGRNGMDELSRMLLLVVLILMVFAGIFSLWACLIIGLAVMFLAYFRILSKNVSARFRENKAYLELRSNARLGMNNLKKKRELSKTHKQFKCPNCGEKIRIPKGDGVVDIKCPKCRIVFKGNTGTR